MKNLHITIYFTTAVHKATVWLKVYPFTWFFWPIITGNPRGEYHRKEDIKILCLSEGDYSATETKIARAELTDFEPRTHCRLRGGPRILKFLCFRVGFYWYYKTDVGDIYPKRYNYLKDSLHGVKVKYTKLIDSEYFV